MDKRSSDDLFSNLPPCLIHAILKYVPIRDAVKTSILSRQWRYKWVTLPHLTFEKKGLIQLKIGLKDFINQVLLLHQGPILHFKLDMPFDEISQFVNQWLIFLSRNGIRKMILKNHVDDNFQIRSSLYSCQNLTHLEIIHFHLSPPPPTFKGFLCLRCLVLNQGYVSSNTLQTLLADQTLLEVLKLEDCVEGLDLRIHAPNLKILYFSGLLKGISLYAPLLRILSVNFEKDLAPKKSSVCAYIDLLGGLTSLEELKGSFSFFKYLSIGIESCHSPLVFPHLRFIHLTPDAFYDKKVVSVIAHLSNGAPNLQKIKVSYSYFCGLQSASAKLLYMDSECPFHFTFVRLKVIEIGFTGTGNHWGKLIKCLLARSPALETLSCKQSPLFTDTELLKQACKLLAYPRASPNAKILFEKR